MTDTEPGKRSIKMLPSCVQWVYTLVAMYCDYKEYSCILSKFQFYGI